MKVSRDKATELLLNLELGSPFWFDSGPHIKGKTIGEDVNRKAYCLTWDLYAGVEVSRELTTLVVELEGEIRPK